jgi:hypothetical protein
MCRHLIGATSFELVMHVGLKPDAPSIGSEQDGWPNKFEDRKCENEDCGQVQDVRSNACTFTRLGE